MSSQPLAYELAYIKTDRFSIILLKNYVDLELEFNHIWDEWVKAIMEKMELKEWVKLNLLWNNISKGMEERLKEWGKSYHDKWINCEIYEPIMS